MKERLTTVKRLMQKRRKARTTTTKGIQVEVVTFSEGMTLNLGNYESYRADMSVTLTNDEVSSTKAGRLSKFKEMEAEAVSLVDKALSPKLESVKVFAAKSKQGD